MTHQNDLKIPIPNFFLSNLNSYLVRGMNMPVAFDVYYDRLPLRMKRINLAGTDLCTLRPTTLS